MIADDLELLARYARDGAEDAFAALVRRHSDLVYSVALRIVRSPQLAEEVAQSVFIELSRNANRMNPGVILSAWLYRVTRSKSVDAMRRESRRQRREQAATALDATGPEAPADDLEPLLDDALDSLTENDRAAIVLRFFERKSLTDVGDALGVSNDAAQKRVSRAVDQLRVFFTRQGLAAGSAGVAAMLAANSAKAAPAGLATGICTAVKTSVSTLSTTSLISTILMTTTQKIAVAAVIALAAGFTIYQIQKGPDAAREKNAGQSMSSTVLRDTGSSSAPDGAVRRGPRYLLKPRLDEARKHQLKQNPAVALMGLSKRGEENWSNDDDDQLVTLAAQDPAAAMKWVEDGGGGAVLAQNLGAVAAGILLRDGKDAMRRFLDAHQQDPELRPKDQGELEKYLFYHLGREDTFDMAMEILRETMKSSKDAMRSFLDEHHLDPQLLPKDEMELEEYLHQHLGREDTFDEAMKILADTTNASAMAGMMISGIEGAQFKTNAIDYMESKEIPVDFDYWSMQEDIGKDPRYWADWARQRDSELLTEIVDGWARDHPAEAKAWVAGNVQQNDKRRADIDELLESRANPPVMDKPDADKPE